MFACKTKNGMEYCCGGGSFTLFFQEYCQIKACQYCILCEEVFDNDEINVITDGTYILLKEE